MDFSILESLNLKKVSTEVLQLMYRQIYQELNCRRACIAVSERNAKAHQDSQFLRMPNEKYEYNRYHLKFLDDLIRQDWSHLFSGSSDKRYYVYAHISPSGKSIRHSGEVELMLNGRPFYIGKGTGDRAYDLKRNQGHGVELSQLLNSGHRPNEIVQIIKDEMTEPEALELESKLIYFFGTKFERHRRGLLVNIEIPKTPFNL